MTYLSKISNIFHRDFLKDKTEFCEIQTNMKVKVISSGCNHLNFSLDRSLSALQYKGGLFPFFEKVAGVHSVCDYIVFAERSGIQYIILIEMKKGKQGTFPQLDAAECFVNYLMSTVNRIYKTNYTPIIRRISINEFKLSKKLTLIKDIEYDINNHYVLKQNQIYLSAFLK